MDRLGKALLKLTAQERQWAEKIFEQMTRRDFTGLNVKKLKGYDNIFRIRKGQLRIIYRLEGDCLDLLYLGRRDEKTYKI
jgi:mRNA-degrading endonuclease RelE of RelBE toxin-antitoxin system